LSESDVAALTFCLKFSHHGLNTANSNHNYLKDLRKRNLVTKLEEQAAILSPYL
jgi:hypothetical protein